MYDIIVFVLTCYLFYLSKVDYKRNLLLLQSYMKQKLWNQLKIKLCAKQKWVKDQQSSKCQCCGKFFNFIRRRHHCRFCGKLYCNNCSDFYINGNYLGLNERFVRHCEFCKEEIQKIKRDLNKYTFMVHDEEQFKHQQSSDSQNEDIQQINEEDFQYASELQAQTMSLYTKLFKKCIELGRLKKEFQGTNLLGVLFEIVYESKMNILPNRQNIDDKYMDITEQLGIKIINGPPAKTLQLIRGIALQKSLPLKKMLDFLVHPQVILIQNSLDQSIAKIKFQDLIYNQRLIYEQIEQKVMKLNPDIIFVEKIASREIIDFFSEKGITVISGLQKDFINSIMHFSGIRQSIKNIWNIDKLKPSNVIGSIDLMQLKTFQSNQTLIYFEKNMGIYTLLISQQAGQAQLTLKKNLQFLLKLIRQISLQRFLIHLDYEMWQDRQSSNAYRLFRLNTCYLSLLQKMKYQSIAFNRMKLSRISLSQQDDKKIREYCKSKGKQYILNFCGQIIEKEVVAYDQYDCTIGYFLLTIAPIFLEKCSECKEHHRERYYFDRYGVEITINSLKMSIIERNLENEDDLTTEQLDKIIDKYKENSNVFSYFQCKQCGSIVSKRVKICKNYLKNSYYYFVYLVTNSEEWNDEQTMNIISRFDSYSTSKSQCSHPSLYRVLQTSDIIFKMQVFPIKKYRLSFVDYNSPRQSSIYHQKLNRFMLDHIELQYRTKQQFINSLKVFIGGYIAILFELKPQNSSDYKIVSELQKLQSTLKILQDMHSYLYDSVYCKQKLKQLTESYDITYYQRQIAKINFVLNIIISIIQNTQNFLQKNKKKIEQNNILFAEKSSNNSFISQSTENVKFNKKQSEQNQQVKIQFQNPHQSTTQFLSVGKNQQDVVSMPNILDIQVPQFSQKGFSKSQDRDYDINSVIFRKMSITNYLFNLTEDTESSDRSFPFMRRPSPSHYMFNLVQEQQKFKIFVKQMTKNRYQLHKGKYLYYTVVNYKNPLTVLVCALNSMEFNDQFQKKGSVKFRFSLIVSNVIHTKWEIKTKVERIRNQIQEYDVAEEREAYEVIAYHHREFQEFREMEGLTQDVYIKSLSTCQLWDTSGGKSKATFSKSRDDILVVKTIKEQQFVQFQKFTSDYLKYIKQCREQYSTGSYLTKIYGIYQLSIRGKSYKCVVMKNLLFGLDKTHLTTYDLKGSQLNRLIFYKPDQQKRTGLDTNFKIDKDYHPFNLQGKSVCDFMQLIKKDIDFLSKNEVIDYSILVIENQSQRELRLGIIDFMRPYHLKEKFENIYKEIYYGMQPTVLPPQEYSSRFYSAIKKYFIISNTNNNEKQQQDIPNKDIIQ